MNRIEKKDVGISEKNPGSVQDGTLYPGESFREHFHDYYEILMVMRGKMNHKINGQEILMEQGSICFLRPDDIHFIRNSSKNRKLQYINIVFSRELLAESSKLIGPGINYDINEGNAKVLKADATESEIFVSKSELIRKISENRNNNNNIKYSLIRGLIIDCLLMFYRNENTKANEAPDWLISACNKMRQPENFKKGLAVFIQLSGKSQEHLTRCMKKSCNDTPQAFITRLRIQEAARLLRNSRKKLEEIAYETGFNNISYFRRCFNAQYGMPPVRYLRRSKLMYNPEFKPVNS